MLAAEIGGTATMKVNDVLVIGCGVSGLTTGILLQRQGRRVTIWTRDVPPHTTSNIAAAVWYPYEAGPADRAATWGAVAYEAFDRLLGQPETGVVSRNLIELLPERRHDDPLWKDSVEGFRHARPDELPESYADGIVFDAPVIDTSIYLNYLRSQFEGAGGVIVEGNEIHDLGEAFAACNVVVNCAGLGARELAHDESFRPTRGQVVRIRPNGYSRVVIDEDGPVTHPYARGKMMYIVPRINDIILGGTAIDDDQSISENVSEQVDDAETWAIIRRCAAIAPEFATLTPDDILEVKIGLRPVRPEVRLEVERISPDRWLVSNYGHGGAGITLSWGCAAEVAEHVAAIDTP